MRVRVAAFAIPSRPCLGSALSIRSAPRSCACMPSFSACGPISPSSTPTTSCDCSSSSCRRKISMRNAGQRERSPNLIDGWKNRGVDPGHVPPSKSVLFAGGRGAALYESYQARLKALNAVDFGDLLLEPLRLMREHDDILAAFRRQLPLHSGRRVPGHQCRPVSLAPPPRPDQRQSVLRRRRRSVDLCVARRGCRKHPAVRAGLSRREGDQARAKLSLGRPHPRGRCRTDRAQPRPSRQDAVHRQTAGREADSRRSVGRPRRSKTGRRGDRGVPTQGRLPQRCRDPGPRLVSDARIRGAVHRARPPLQGHRRTTILRAGGNPRRPGLSSLRRPTRRRPCVRAHL